MKIVADANIPYIKDFFGCYGELVLKPGRTITASDVDTADMLIVRSITPVDAKLLENSKVRFVGSVTAGADHLDTQWLSKAGIFWTVANGFNAPPVADYVVAVIAALQQQRILPSAKMKAAVIGVGHVGRRVVENLQALDFNVVLCDPIRANQEKNFFSTTLADLNDLDLISLHVPLTKTTPFPTYHFIDKPFLQRQKPGCVLLNASRGAVINTDDLLEAGKNLYWCLDVWEHEPNIRKEVLERATIATPHIAGYSIQSKIRGIDMIYSIACDKKLIQPQTIVPILVPEQVLQFTGELRDWQEVILQIFNPAMLSTKMQAALSSSKTPSHSFDDMRNQFNDRHEFAFTKFHSVEVTPEANVVLRKLGLTSLTY